MEPLASDTTLPRLSQAPRAPDVLSDCSYDAWHLQVLSSDEFNAMSEHADRLSRAQLLYLAWFGLLAPTSHNTIPQRLQLLTQLGQIVVWLDREFVLPHSDKTGRQATISCGCAIANLCIAAATYGWQATVQQFTTATADTTPWNSSSAKVTELAGISFHRHAGPALENCWLQAMLERKIVRAEYDPRVTLSEDAAAAMRQTVQKFPTLRLHLLTDTASLMVLGKFQELADTTVFNREDFSRELGKWLLANDDTSPFGMRGREFGLSDEAALRFHRGLSGKARLLPDEVAALAKGANVAMRSASAVVVLTADRDTTAARLDAGRAYGELALLLHTLGYVTSMHAAITEVEAPNMALRGRLRATWRPVVVFRVGKPIRALDGRRPHSVRPPLMDIILPEDSAIDRFDGSN